MLIRLTKPVIGLSRYVIGAAIKKNTCPPLCALAFKLLKPPSYAGYPWKWDLQATWLINMSARHAQFIPMVVGILTAGHGEQRLWVRGCGYGLIWKNYFMIITKSNHNWTRWFVSPSDLYRVVNGINRFRFYCASKKNRGLFRFRQVSFTVKFRWLQQTSNDHKLTTVAICSEVFTRLIGVSFLHNDIHRGCNMPVPGYEFNLRVFNSISHEWAQRTSVFLWTND